MAENTELKAFAEATENLKGAAKSLIKKDSVFGKELKNNFSEGFKALSGPFAGMLKPVKILAKITMISAIKKVIKDKRKILQDEKLFKAQFNLNKDQIKRLKEQKIISDANKKWVSSLSDAAENLLGLDAKKVKKLLEQDKTLDEIKEILGLESNNKVSEQSKQTSMDFEAADKKNNVDVGAAGAEQAKEEKIAQQKQQSVQQKQSSLLGQMADGIKDLNKSFMKSLKNLGKKGLSGLGIVVAMIAAPIIMLVSFFKQLAIEFKFLKALTGKGLTKLFAPLKNLFTGKGPIGKAFTSLSKTLKTISSTIKGSKSFKAIGTAGKTVKSVITSLGKFFAPMIRFFKSVFGLGKSLVSMSKTAMSIVKFAGNFGRILGKIFLPITILMSAFDFITGFMKGYEEGGILGGLEGGLTKLFQGLIGMPLDLLKSAVSWILGVFGWDSAEKWLDSFSFSTLIGDMISGMFDMIGKVVDWVKLLFTDPVAALSKLWDTLTGGIASIMDFIWSPIKAGIAWVMRLFGWDEAAAATESFSISGFINGIFATIKVWFTDLFSWGAEADKDKEGKWSLSTMVLAVFGKVKTWFTNLFSWASTEDDKDSWVIKTIKGVIGTVKTWLGNMFKFDSASSILASAFNVLTFLPNIIFKGLTLVTKWLLGLFGFDDAAKTLANADDWTIGSMIVTAFNKVKDWVVDLFSWGEKKERTASKGFSLAKILGDTVNKIWEWFKGLLDIDIMAIAKSIPGAETLLKWMKGDTPEEAVKEYGQTLKAAEKSNLYDSNWRGDSTINREALQKGVTSGVVQKDMLNAILADKDMSDEDTAFIQDLLKPKRKSAGIRPLAEGETIRGRIKENRKESPVTVRGGQIGKYLEEIKTYEKIKKSGIFGSGDMRMLDDLRKKVTELQRQNQAAFAGGNVAVNAPTHINTKYSTNISHIKTVPGANIVAIGQSYS